jgi:hypothetical protein
MLAYLHAEDIEGLRKALKLSPAAISPLYSLTKIASPYLLTVHLGNAPQQN